MSNSYESLFLDMWNKFVSFLPNLLTGVLLVIIGWFISWVVKRVVIQIAILIRLDRFFISFRWGKDFSKADVRYSLYNSLGNIAFLIIFLVFLNSALKAWNLLFISTLLEGGILFFPKFVIALLIFFIGWLIASWTSNAIQRALIQESVPKPTLISRFAKTVVLIFFSAISLVELNIAREIVIIGFATIIITLGLLAIVITFIGGKEFINSISDSFNKE